MLFGSAVLEIVLGLAFLYFFISLAIQVRALWIEGRVLGENERLMRRVDRQIRSADSDAEPARAST